MKDFESNLNSEKVQAAHPVEPLAVETDMSVEDALAILRSQKTGSLVVCQEGKLVGIFTERDALQLLAKNADLKVPIETVMIRNPVTVSRDATVGQAIKKMSDGGYRRLPIVDDQGYPTGVVKVSGIIRFIIEHVPETVYTLPPQPNEVMKQREGA